MDIGAWLKSLGLSQYEPRFRDQQIDTSTLARLRTADFERLIEVPGDRSRLVAALQALKDGPPSEMSFAAQRRQLTVMFCDLADSTALSTALDPEDMHALIRAYHHAAAERIERAGGFVAKYLGDGVLAYFGYS